MNARHDKLVIGGRLHISIPEVARCYGVQVEFVQEVYRYGLLGPGERSGQEVLVAATELDKVARIIRLHFYQGIEIPTIGILLDSMPPE